MAILAHATPIVVGLLLSFEALGGFSSLGQALKLESRVILETAVTIITLLARLK